MAFDSAVAAVATNMSWHGLKTFPSVDGSQQQRFDANYNLLLTIAAQHSAHHVKVALIRSMCILISFETVYLLVEPFDCIKLTASNASEYVYQSVND